ncbi:MAG: alkaline phosphatase family protein [Pyrinomonadaceae bacterium]|nr:alkaline phosphatase family protein [Pyrinomonadaceae bacterium]
MNQFLSIMILMKIDSFFHSRSSLLKRRALLLVAFFLLAALTLLFASSREAESRALQGKTKRVLIISVDGLDARYLNRRDEFGLKIPNLRRLMSEGAAARGVVSVFPSVTYPAHTTIVTGAYPARHRIYGNEVLEPPMGTARREWNWYARDIRAETLWDAARKRGLKVGMVSWPVGVGAGDYNVPEIIRFGGTLLDTLARIKGNSIPQGLLGEIEKRDAKLYAQANKDEQDDMRTRMAEYIITEKRPDVMLIHLFDLDHFQHEKGPFTPESLAILEKSDAYIGRIIEAARRAGTIDETAIFIVSDHGFMPISKLVNPGVLLERAGLLTVREEKDAKGNYVSVLTGWRAVPFVTNGSCAIILRDENDKEALKKVREIFRPLAGREESGIREVIEGVRLRALGANTRAAMMLDAADGYAFDINYKGELITNSAQRGAHGYMPTRPDYYTSFIAAGAGIRPAQLGTIRMIDIGPTIARTLGLTLKDAEGRSIRLQ